ncbi:unnamed protein product [Sphagnum jensenii]|uniref:Uncharacterized protein n=1 Tax=Sphagnum jensenii TaxID=128206 RepID=A0ABP1C3X1_9BRYO
MERLQGGAIELSLCLLNDCRTDLRRYNAPIVNEVGALMVGGDVDEANARDIVICSACLSPTQCIRATTLRPSLPRWTQQMA